MLSILGQRPSSFCDGHSRRHFLKIGGLALGDISSPLSDHCRVRPVNMRRIHVSAGFRSVPKGGRTIDRLWALQCLDCTELWIERSHRLSV